MEPLEWEMDDSPKWDKHFDDNQDGIHVAASTEDIEAREAIEDCNLQERFARQHQAWLTINPELIQQATNVLLPYVMPDRWERIQSVFKKPTQNARFWFENPANPSNVWACLRTLAINLESTKGQVRYFSKTWYANRHGIGQVVDRS